LTTRHCLGRVGLGCGGVRAGRGVRGRPARFGARRRGCHAVSRSWPEGPRARAIPRDHRGSPSGGRGRLPGHNLRGGVCPSEQSWLAPQGVLLLGLAVVLSV